MTVTTLRPVLTSAREFRGYVHAFDQHGQQMPEYQGPFTEVREAIERAGVTIERRGLSIIQADRKTDF